MARVNLTDVQAWGEQTKMATALTSITAEPNASLLAQVESIVLARIGTTYDTTTWVDPASTPATIRTIISMMFVSWVIDRQYSEDEDLNAYAARLAGQYEVLLAGIIDGSIELPGVPNTTGSGQPSFWPNNTTDGPAFSMGQVF
jgi:hypothetical protein